MSTRAARRKNSAAPARGEFLRNLRLHIRCRPHTTKTLARKLGVSIATAARGIAELRRLLARQGESLVSLKEGQAWRYEIREEEGLGENDWVICAGGSVEG